MSCAYRKITIPQDAQVDDWVFRAKLPDNKCGECYPCDEGVPDYQGRGEPVILLTLIKHNLKGRFSSSSYITYGILFSFNKFQAEPCVRLPQNLTSEILLGVPEPQPGSDPLRCAGPMPSPVNRARLRAKYCLNLSHSVTRSLGQCCLTQVVSVIENLLITIRAGLSSSQLS